MADSYLHLLALHDDRIQDWIRDKSQSCKPALYGSMDIRDSGFKAAVIDSNLYPAGFNNLSPQDWPQTSALFKAYLSRHLPQAKRLLIIAEEHTRNTWYIDHLHTLEKRLRDAGYEVLSATFLDPKVDSVCTHTFKVDLESATKGPFEMYCLHHVLDEVEGGRQQLDAIIYNNDLTSGLPKRLRTLKIPAFPSPWGGWFQRRKSAHFIHANALLTELGSELGIDPWFFTTDIAAVEGVSVNEEADRQRLAEAVAAMLDRLKAQYAQYGISEQPGLFLKADSGTYGMGVLGISDPQDILDLNRKARNNLSKGKSAQPIVNFVLQEGIPTALDIDRQVAEPCLYLVDNQVAGAFYRLNSLKGRHENLNSQGMSFSGLSVSQNRSDAFRAYGILAQIAGLATGLEIQELERART